MHRRSPVRGNLGVMALCLALAGCGAVRSSADNPLTVGGLTPKVEDKDAGLVAVAPGLDLKKYKVVVVEKFSVSSGQIEDDGDRRLAEKCGLHRLGGCRRECDGGQALRCPGASSARRNHAARPESKSLGAGRIRVSGGMQWFGGDDEEILNESFDDMARDLAKFLVRLSKGEAPSKSP